MMGIVKKAIKVESKTDSVVFMDLVGWIKGVDGLEPKQAPSVLDVMKCGKGSLIFHGICTQDDAKSKSQVTDMLDQIFQLNYTG